MIKNFFLVISLAVVMFCIYLIILKDMVIENASGIYEHRYKHPRTLLANILVATIIIYGLCGLYWFVDFFGGIIALEIIAICFISFTLIFGLSVKRIEADLS